jgi:hypothetical protein
MFLSFQSKGFQNYAFQTFFIGSNPPIVIDTHDGGLPKKRHFVPEYEFTKKPLTKLEKAKKKYAVLEPIVVQAIAKPELLAPNLSKFTNNIDSITKEIEKLKLNQTIEDNEFFMLALSAVIH